MIFELYGIPGAGKTTIIKRLTGGNATTVSGSAGLKKYVILLAKKISLYSPFSVYYKIKIRKTVLKYKDANPVYTHTTLRHHINNIVLVPFGYRTMRGDVYMDEGLIHRVVTMAVNYKFSDSDLLAVLNVFSDLICKIECEFLDVPVDLCFESIRNRNRHECEMDEFDDVILREYLSDFDHYCRLVCIEYGHESIYRDNI